MGEISNRNSRQRHKTFPKEGEKKSKDTIQKLKARIKYLEKKIKFYEDKVVETEGYFIKSEIVRPEDNTELIEHRKEEFRKDFLKRFRDSLKDRGNNEK